MYPKNKKLFENATSYVKDGKLIKFRFHNENRNHPDSVLSYKSCEQLEVDVTEIDYLKGKGNLAIETNGQIETFNFDEDRLKICGLIK